jgi:tricorn protease
MVTSPSLGIYGLDGHWEVENHGIPPSPGDEVEQDPKAMHEGRDPQLDKAIAVVLQMLKANPPKQYVRPPFHVYHHPLPTIPH